MELTGWKAKVVLAAAIIQLASLTFSVILGIMLAFVH